ncbi:hypothetical protein SBA5_200003 [Candidatus Sulfotelmatomonas gaucii]|uniref:Uncharacterized protein n=1 Tax=Candidatus Sulfuritelmatomonas gaucii TaxID=2043161 RepID=A0A2N9L777_9BACT|nr:hypothetical protein SBA5_200003 [Candidatus Sulfotelmatomonas gaucii]
MPACLHIIKRALLECSGLAQLLAYWSECDDVRPSLDGKRCLLGIPNKASVKRYEGARNA